MKRFPEAVREAMRSSGASATCLPVQLDGDAWEAALFIEVAGPECKEDRRILQRCDGALAVGLETDLIETDFGAVVVLRPEIHTRPGNPFVCEILLTPGEGGAHFDALYRLCRQPRLCWFFADQAYWLVHSQQHPLDAEQHRAFDELMRDAVKHNAMIRMTRRYDALAALGEVVKHYELRAGTPLARRT